MKLRAGTMVNPRVRLREPLGRGAMGSVWLAEHLTLETDVAVKFIKPELADEETGGLLERFKREAKAAARIKSPHVVQTLDHGFMEDDTPYIVMELLEGETLGERLARVGRVRLREIVEIVTQVGRGLTKAHELGIVHRDIKPDNVFLIGEGEDLLVKILDFGVAKQVKLPAGAATASGTLVGTPQYMSPEQLLRSEDLGPQADLWALSVVAYQAMLGRPPFEGETLAGIIVAITQAKFPRPSSVDERLARAMDAWADRALALEPQARFATAKALADAFRSAVEGVQSADPSLTTVHAEAPLESPEAEPQEPLTASELAATAEFISDAALDVVSEAVAESEDGPGSGASSPSDGEASEEESPASGPDEERGAAVSVDAQTSVSTSSPTLSSPQGGGPTGRREQQGRRWAPAAMAVLAVGAFALWLSRDAQEGGATEVPAPEPTAAWSAPSAAATAAARPTAASSVAAVVDGGTDTTKPAKLEPRTITAGRTPDGAIWLPSYRLMRDADDGDESYLDAQARCRGRSMALCTEAQWVRACAQDGSLGAIPSWTASAAADQGFVVRGGDGTCSARGVVDPAERDPQRAGLCCARVVGIRSSNRSLAFVKSVAGKLSRIEQAFTTGNRSLLSSLVGERIDYGGKVMLKDQFVKRAAAMFHVQPDGWILHDVCDVALFEEEGQHAWSADCTCVTLQGTKLGHWLRRYVHDSTSGKIRSVEVPKVYRAAAPP